MTTTQVLLYADDRLQSGKDAIAIFKNCRVPVTVIPLSGGFPEATFNNARYIGLPEIRTLRTTLRQLFSDEF